MLEKELASKVGEVLLHNQNLLIFGQLFEKNEVLHCQKIKLAHVW